MINDQTNFMGNDKHLKMLRLSLQKKDPSVWNDFAKSQGPQFSADLQGIDLSHCDLQGYNFRYARLTDAILDDANLKAADMSHATLTGASFKNAQMEGTKLKVKAKIRTIYSPGGEIPPEILADPLKLRRYKLDTLQKQAENLLKSKEMLRVEKEKENKRKVHKQSNSIQIMDDDNDF